jgi:CRP-like cAMP-binding protein
VSDELSSQVARELFLRVFLGGATDVSGDTAARLARRVEDVWVPAGRVLYRAGEPADEHFFVVDGEIEVTAPEGGRWRFGERSIVGILDVSQERPRTRTATVLRESHLLRLRAAEWFDILEDDFEFARGAIHNIARAVTRIHLSLGGRGFETATPPNAKIRSSPLSFVDRTLLLRAVPPFRRASVQAAVDLIPYARLRDLQDREALFETGGAKRSIFVVANGSIALEHEGVTVANFGAATLLSGLGSLSPEPWPAAARAAEGPARVIELDFEDVYDAMEEHFDLVKSALSELTHEREALQAFEIGADVLAAG